MSTTSKSKLAKELAAEELKKIESKLAEEVKKFQEEKPKVTPRYSPARLPRDEYHLHTSDMNAYGKTIHRKVVHPIFTSNPK